MQISLKGIKIANRPYLRARLGVLYINFYTSKPIRIMFELGKNEIKFLYNSNKMEDKEAYAYALTLHKHTINELDVSKNDMTPTQFSELAKKLDTRIIDLFDKDSDYFKKNIQGKDIVESDLLTLLVKEKSALKTPILITEEMATVLAYPRDTISMDMVFQKQDLKEEKTNKTVMGTPSVSEESVQKATGRSWVAWFAFLNNIEAEKLPHKEIAATLYEQAGVSGWWAQSITVAYERMIGRREVGQSCVGGFRTSAGKTFSGTMDKVLIDWQEFVKGIDRFNEVPFNNLPQTSETEKWRYWRVGLRDGSLLSVNINQKSTDKVLLAVNHEKLADAQSVKDWKEYWKSFLKQFDDQF